MASSDKDNRSSLEKDIMTALKEWEEFDIMDFNLWEAFVEDFKSYAEDDFKPININLLRRFRIFLRKRGVWVLQHPRTTIAKSLSNTLQEKEPTPWTEDEIRRCRNENFTSNLISNLLQEDFGRNPRVYSTYASPSSAAPAMKPEPALTFGPVPAPVPPPKFGTSAVGPEMRPGLAPTIGPAPTMRPELGPGMGPKHTPALGPALPPTGTGTGTAGHGRELANLAKMYTDEAKYSGENDSLTFKLTIFHDICARADIPHEAKLKALPTMLKGLALDYYYSNVSMSSASPVTFDEVCYSMRAYFEGAEYRRGILSKWNGASLQTTIDKTENQGKSMEDCLQLLIQDLRHLQHGLDPELRTDKFIHNKLINACQNVPACQYACFKPSDTLAGLINDLRSSIVTFQKSHPSETFFTDRRYHKFSDNRHYHETPRPARFQSRVSYDRDKNGGRDKMKNVCFVCNKEGCWSTKHTKEERDKSKTRLKNRLNNRFDKRVDQYISDFENAERDPEEDSLDDKIEELIIDAPLSPIASSSETEDVEGNFITSFGTLDQAKEITENLSNRSFKHSLLGVNSADLDSDSEVLDPFTYIATERYTSDNFYGIMIDTGASKHSTAGYGQYLAYNQGNDAPINTTKAGAVHVQFGIGSTSSIGSITVDTPMGLVEFHVVKADTPFLLSLADMDRLGVYFNNVKNILVLKHGSRSIPVIRRFGHPFLLETALQSYISQSFDKNPCYLTETELRQLHRRFGHPSALKLRLLLERSGHGDNKAVLDKLTKYCSFCQKHSKSPGRFKFTLREDVNFNFSIIVDIMYIDNSPILHVVDESTRFQAAKWLRDVSAKHTWDTLRLCWIDVYLGPPDYILHDAGKNFVSKEFRQLASSIAITTKSVPVEAHWSVGIVERYHAVLRRAYKIISDNLQGTSLNRDSALQMAVKAVNDTAGPNGLVPTLLVFGAYPRMHKLDPPAPSIHQRAAAIKKAMNEVQKYRAERQVADALNTRNGPVVNHLHDLPLNTEVLVWREGNAGRGNWTGPFKLLGIDGETCKVSLPSGLTEFRSTVVKPYLSGHNQNVNSPPGSSMPFVKQAIQVPTNSNPTQKPAQSPTRLPIQADPIQERAQSLTRVPIQADPTQDLAQSPTQVPVQADPTQNPIQVPTTDPAQDSTVALAPFTKRPIRIRRQPIRYQNIADISILVQDTSIPIFNSDAVFTSPTVSFADSRRKEINGLLEKKVFKIVALSEVPRGTRIFNSRFVDEVKNVGTATAFEKSRLVVQAYNDHDKDMVLTQALTIQRMSQRLILALAASIPSHSLYLRDISQAYVQSATFLTRKFYVRPPRELGLQESVLQIIKPLYGVPEAGAHWFSTYHTHHTERLSMISSTYDLCLLFTSRNSSSAGFGVVGLQTDDTLILADKIFAAAEEKQLHEAKLLAKDREKLTSTTPIKFNGGYIRQEATGEIYLSQEKQCKNICLVTLKAPLDLVSSRGQIRKAVTPKDQYVAQRARGAYVATVCQPEAAFDLSFAAQVTYPKEDDAKALNKRLKWQIDHFDRGLRFVKLDTTTLRLLVFSDAAFANNHDLSSQIGYVIVLADAMDRANIVHWSSIKCKRVTRSVLASELYAMAYGFDAGAVIKSTVEKILGIPVLPLIACIDSRSLYECLVKLGSTQEKRLMVDIMCLRQSYERREIMEVKWIDGDSNPADAMTKARPCQALQDLIDTNTLNLRTTGWVERGGKARGDEQEHGKGQEHGGIHSFSSAPSV